MTANTIEAMVRACYGAWETGDRDALAELLSDDFTFTSPNDDHLTLAQYWDVCWPHRDRIKGYTILTLLTGENEATVRYDCDLTNGSRFRNMEHFRFAGDKIVAVEVYFGRTLNTTTS